MNNSSNNPGIDPFVFLSEGSPPAPAPMPPQHQPLLVQYPVPPVLETREVDKGSEFTREMLTFDDRSEHMLLLTFRERYDRKDAESPDLRFGTNVRSHSTVKHNALGKELSIGCVRLIRVYRLADKNGNVSPPQCEVEILFRNPIGMLSLPVDAIFRKDKSVQNALAEKHVVFIGSGFRIWCEKFAEEINRERIQTERTGFYKDENNCWNHARAAEIALKAVDSQGILERLGINFSLVTDNSMLRLTLFLYGICGRICTVIRDIHAIPMAKLAIVCSERGVAMEDLKQLYCSNDNPPVFTEKSFEEHISSHRDEVALVSLSSTGYMKSKCLETLIRLESELTTVPLLLSDNDKDFCNRNDIVLLNYSVMGIGGIDGELCWAVRTLLNVPMLSIDLEKAFERYDGMLECETESVAICNLIAVLMSLAEVYLPRLGVMPEKLVAVLQRYKDYLLDRAYSSSQDVIERLKTFLTSYRDVPLKCFDGTKPNNEIILKNDMILLTCSMIEHVAEKCGTSRMPLINFLSENGALWGNESRHMRNVRFGSVTERMYAINSSVLFDVGELRPMCVNEMSPKPLYKIPIGTADEYEICYDVYSFDSGNNPFVLITGATGTGKSTLCRTLAVNAARLGLSVVILGTDSSRADLECKSFEIDDNIIEFLWDKALVDGEISQVTVYNPEKADDLLEEFYNYKAKQSETRHTLLLLDEAQEFSWNGESPLVSKILRQGRKFGIVGVFSTQFLNSDNGKNISAALGQIKTRFVFKPSDTTAAMKYLDYQSSNEKARDALNFLDTGEVLAKGHLSAEKYLLDYTVKFTVNPNFLNDIL